MVLIIAALFLPSHGLLLGTAMKGNWEEKASQEEIDGIVTRCSTLFPELGDLATVKSQIVKTWVGLRPYREEVRLEFEMPGASGITIPVVHNYGHGGSGWTLFWGCANEAAELGVNYLRSKFEIHPKAKL